jgi:hypothetical protein
MKVSIRKINLLYRKETKNTQLWPKFFFEFDNFDEFLSRPKLVYPGFFEELKIKDKIVRTLKFPCLIACFMLKYSILICQIICERLLKIHKTF